MSPDTTPGTPDYCLSGTLSNDGRTSIIVSAAAACPVCVLHRTLPL
jgi:hypothetical protein